MHGGSVHAFSEGPGRGTELMVRLPLAAAVTTPVARAAARRAEAAAVLPLRVLVVDDNVDAAETLSRMLRLQAHEVVMAHDGVTALATASQMNPDVVLLDIGLPQLDGLEVARRLRERAEGRRPLLVAMTGFGQDEDRARTAAAGFDHHLTKPVDVQLLNSLIQTARSPSP
jgi:two-component system CheB/CheR fusion protein